MKKEITIYLVIRPWDYTSADVDVFESREEAEMSMSDYTKSQRHYFRIVEHTLKVKFPNSHAKATA